MAPDLAPGKTGPKTNISRAVVQALKVHTGRGPTKARTLIHEDCVVVLLGEGHTVAEKTLYRAGDKRAVAQSRVDVWEVVREPLMGIIEEKVGCKVVGFMSSSQQDPDLLSYVFVLETSPLVAHGEVTGSD